MYMSDTIIASEYLHGLLRYNCCSIANDGWLFQFDSAFAQSFTAALLAIQPPAAADDAIYSFEQGMWDVSPERLIDAKMVKKWRECYTREELNENTECIKELAVVTFFLMPLHMIQDSARFGKSVVQYSELEKLLNVELDQQLSSLATGQKKLLPFEQSQEMCIIRAHHEKRHKLAEAARVCHAGFEALALKHGFTCEGLCNELQPVEDAANKAAPMGLDP